MVAQDDLASIRLDRDATGIDLSGAPQRLLNLALDLDWWDLRADFNAVDDPLNAADARNRFFRPLKLVAPLDLAFQRHQSVVDDDLDSVPR
jgi:hypothetical protein